MLSVRGWSNSDIQHINTWKWMFFCFFSNSICPLKCVILTFTSFWKEDSVNKWFSSLIYGHVSPSCAIWNEKVRVGLIMVPVWTYEPWHFMWQPSYAEKGHWRTFWIGTRTTAAKWIEGCPRKWLKSSQEYVVNESTSKAVHWITHYYGSPLK